MKLRSFCLAVVLLATPCAFAFASAGDGENIRLVGSVAFSGATDVAFDRSYAFVGDEYDAEKGVHVIDISGDHPREVASVPCQSSQNDVAIVRHGLLALGYFDGSCEGPEEPVPGVSFFDVTDPKAPRFLSHLPLPFGTHTLTEVPGSSLVYASSAADGMYIIDASNPVKPRVVGRMKNKNCHDVSFFVSDERRLGFCSISRVTEIWDITDPTRPRVLSVAGTPGAHWTTGYVEGNVEGFAHSSASTSDGRFLVVGYEHLQGAPQECTSLETEQGALWMFDISNPKRPRVVNHIDSTRGQLPLSESLVAPCTAHNFNVIPGTKIVVSAWFTGGTRVIDFSSKTPKEIAYFAPSDANTWASYWYRGRIYTGDTGRGFDVLETTIRRAEG